MQGFNRLPRNMMHTSNIYLNFIIFMFFLFEERMKSLQTPLSACSWVLKSCSTLVFQDGNIVGCIQDLYLCKKKEKKSCIEEVAQLKVSSHHVCRG